MNAPPYIGEIRRFPYLPVPMGWLTCDGQLLSTNEYAALYGLIANTYGGDANSNTFALPDLRGCVTAGAGGNAGALGATEFNPGPPQAWESVVFAICWEGVYPAPPKEI